VDQLRLDKVVNDIDQAFGPELRFAELPPSDEENAVLGRIFGDRGFQAYLQDQVNRQIIRDYLTNAVLLGFVTDRRLAFYTGRAGTSDGRALLSLHMLMSSVEDAEYLPVDGDSDRLQPLQGAADSPPHMELVRS
jgi:hypothetical protein